MRRIFSIAAVAAAIAVSAIFWAIMIALVSWSVVFLTRGLNTLVHTTALSFWQSVELLVFLCCLMIIPLRGEGLSEEGEDRHSKR